ncbi:hypothetical protein M378DRAFT_340675 [Amanita muscaria Koide BX008]|uniref:Uncharacterized protein n=1 Tax=Amanita muscaria (strain Koide BX008) TaxID=946122 RepID=A0A0C2WA58_AMAMK|nr:hypothetical protein M378DRAFT_340675 [Amanita muscaria Koide BX008]
MIEEQDNSDLSFLSCIGSLIYAYIGPCSPYCHFTSPKSHFPTRFFPPRGSSKRVFTNSDSHYPTTLLQELNNFNFQGVPSPKLPSANDAGPSSSTVGLVDLFSLGRSAMNNASYDHCPPTPIAVSSGHDPESQVDDSTLTMCHTLITESFQSHPC